MKKVPNLIYYGALVLLILSTNSNTLSAQNTLESAQNKFAQFYVVGISSSTESKAIDAFLRTQQGVLMSRTDHNSRILFCIFNEKSVIQESTFISWLNNLGFQISCFREGVHGIDKVYSKEDYRCN